MRPFVESLRKLYKGGSNVVTIEKLQSFLASGKISQEEYDYIIA